MTDARWVFLFFTMYVILDVVYFFIGRKQKRELDAIHTLEVKIAKDDAYNAGYEEARKTLPIVQHCNSDTDYEFIRHRWDPNNCKHCLGCQNLLES